ADREHLLLAAAEGARELTPPLAQARETLEHLGERALDACAVAPPVGAHAEVVEHGHLGKEAPPLRGVREPERHDAMGPPSRDIDAAKHDAGAAPPHEPRERGQGRGLPAPVTETPLTARTFP